MAIRANFYLRKPSQSIDSQQFKALLTDQISFNDPSLDRIVMTTRAKLLRIERPKIGAERYFTAVFWGRFN